MALTIKVKSIRRQHILSVDEWLWIMSHLNTPLPVSSIYWRRDGKVDCATIRKDDENIITLFASNGMNCEVNYSDSDCRV